MSADNFEPGQSWSKHELNPNPAVCCSIDRHSATLWLPSVHQVNIIHSGLPRGNAATIKKDFLSGVLMRITAVCAVLTAPWSLCQIWCFPCVSVPVCLEC